MAMGVGAPPVAEIPAPASVAAPAPAAAGPDFDAEKLEQAGWGVIFAPNTKPEIRAALGPLLERRKDQTKKPKRHKARKPKLYKEYVWQEGDTAAEFLRRHGASSNQVDPHKVPYYLLIVADPVAVSYADQFDLDRQRAVGRIHFKTPKEYAGYANAVVAAEEAAEKETCTLPRRAVVFAPTIDRYTRGSRRHLAMPLARMLKAENPTWKVDTITDAAATKERLGQLLGGGDSAALVFTASHGGNIRYPSRWQTKLQGCVMCQGYEQKKSSRSYHPADFYFSGRDITRKHLPPMITFHFSCFGAGTPKFDEFLPFDVTFPKGSDRPANNRWAPNPFVAYLPQRLLGRPKGGALATIGHVERAWPDYNFGARDQKSIETFEDTLTAIMNGHRVGHAMQVFGRRFSELSKRLARAKPSSGAGLPTDDSATVGTVVEDQDYLWLWTWWKDVRNYVILGDPAVRLPLAPAAAVP